jgi:hypothetical protein
MVLPSTLTVVFVLAARGYSYVWGYALEDLAAKSPDARVMNLETAVTASEDWWKRKVPSRATGRTLG